MKERYSIDHDEQIILLRKPESNIVYASIVRKLRRQYPSYKLRILP